MHLKSLLLFFILFPIIAISQNTVSLSASKNTIGENESIEVIATIPTAVDKDIVIDFELTGKATHLVDFTSDFYSKSVPISIGSGPGTGANQFNTPIASFIDEDGNLFVADSKNARVQKWGPGASEGITVAGGNGIGPATNQFYSPYDVFVDSLDNIYVLDRDHGLIKKWAHGSSEWVTIIGGEYTLPNGWLSFPTSFFIDKNGTFYISDQDNHRVLKWVPGEKLGIVVAGGNGYGSTQDKLFFPSGVAVDDFGNVYVSDTWNHRIQKWAPGAKEGSTIFSDISPANLRIDGEGDLLIADVSNHRVIKLKPGSSEAITIAGGNEQGSAPNQLNQPKDARVDRKGNYYIVDSENHRIQKYQQFPQIVIKSGETTGKLTLTAVDDKSDEDDENFTLMPTISSNGILGSSSPLVFTILDDDNPPMVTLEFSKQIISENSSTDVLLTAKVSDISGKDISIEFITGGLANPSEYALSSKSILIPAGKNSGCLTISTKDIDDTEVETLEWVDFYISSIINAYSLVNSTALYIESDDSPKASITLSSLEMAENGSIEIFATLDSPTSKDVTINFEFPGTAKYSVDFTSEFASKGEIKILGKEGYDARSFNFPTGVSVDGEGNIYVADYYNHRIQKWVPGAFEGITVAKGPASDVFIDHQGNMYITGYDQVQKWAPGATTGIIVAGGNGYGSGANQLSYPSAIFVDSAGQIFISDQDNDRIQKWSPGSTTGVTVAKVDGPSGITLDKFGNIYVSQNHRILKFVPGSDIGITVAGGQEGYNSNQLSVPRGISFDLNGSLLIADYYNHRIQKWEPGAPNGSTIAGGYSYGDVNHVFYPLDVCIDKGGNLYVTDNHTVKRYQYSPEIVIKAGETSGKLTIKGLDDKIVEGDETIVVKLNPVNAITSGEAMTIIIHDNATSLTLSESPFPGLSDGAIAWGDYDRDGDQDVAMMGKDSNKNLETAIFENKEGVFVKTSYNLTGLTNGDISWVDINKDGWIDLVVSGYNDIPRTMLYINSDGKDFIPNNSYGLPQLYKTKMAWGDLENDGDVDLAISGVDMNEKLVFQVYYHDDNQEKLILDEWMNEPVKVNWPGFINGDLELADIDDDGDNDLVYCGEDSDGIPVGGIIYNTIFQSPAYYTNLNLKNSSIEIAQLHTFYNQNALEILATGDNEHGVISLSSLKSGELSILPKLKNGDISSADFDNDGLNDIVFTGENQDGVLLTKLFIHDKYNGFKESGIQLKGLRNSCASWIDFDLDGDLDLFLTGDDEAGAKVLLYEAETTHITNKPPSIITGLYTEEIGNGFIRFNWNNPSDDFSTKFGYVLKLGTTPGGSEISVITSNLENGERLIHEIAPTYNNRFFTKLDPGVYYWSVQAIDHGLLASKFSEEKSFTITYPWKVLNQGGIIDKTISGLSSPFVELIDVDNDSDADLILGSKHSINPKLFKFDGKRLVLSNDNMFNNLKPQNIESGDINGDGKIDYLLLRITADIKCELLVLLSKNDGEFTTINLEGLYNAKAKILDLNNDGQSEILIMGMSDNTYSAVSKMIINEFDKTTLSFIKHDNVLSQLPYLDYPIYNIGDINNDQDIDIVLRGNHKNLGYKLYLLDNISTYEGDFQFNELLHDIKPVRNGSTTLLDFDGDGDLDILSAGNSTSGEVFEVHQNKLNEGITSWPRSENTTLGIESGSQLIYGDFSNDGFSDLIYTKLDYGLGKKGWLSWYDSNKKTYIKNSFDMSNLLDVEIEFGDIDGDGDLDFALSGKDTYENGKLVFRAFLNMQNESAIALQKVNNSCTAFLENKPPDVPVQKEVKLFKKLDNGKLQVEFSWEAPYDDHTPKAGLTYAVKVGTTPGGNEIMSANANSDGVRNSTGKGNVEHNLKWHLNLPNGIFYWSVQAIDASYAGSEFSTPEIFDTRVLSDDLVEIEKTLACYPNPTTGMITMRIPGTDKKGSIIIRDMLGSIVINKEINVHGDRTIETDISTLKNGIYTISVEASNEKYISKIVKM